MTDFTTFKLVRLGGGRSAEKTIAAAVSEWLRTSNIRKLDDAYGPITSLSCACKHWGFHEERETRIVVNPMTSELLQKAPNQEQQVKPLKEIKHRDQSGSLVPYIELFKGSDNPLPIKRVIVGPHLNQDARQRGIESLLRSHGVKADVVKSDIPLVVG